MKKLKLLFASLALLVGSGTAWAQTDVTSTYLTNADFEGNETSYSQPKADRDIYQPEGWAIAYTNGDENDMTSLNSSTTQWSQFSGKPQPTNGGSKAYWMRCRWGSSVNITLSQETSANLPAGTYCISVDAYSDDKTGTATISAAGVSQSVRPNGAWANYKVVFTLASAQKVTVSLNYKNTAADDQVAAFDNVKILDLTSEPSGITLKNVLGGTAASLSDFNVWYDDYTLEVEGTAGTEITVAADNISYTPEATGTVRFVKKDGIVYVYEGAIYKTAVHSAKAAYVYSRTLSKDDPITNNYLKNPSFETTGDFLSGKKYKIGSPWSTNYSGSDIRIDKGTKTGIHGECVLVWRGSGSGKDWYFTQQITTLPKYKGVKIYLQQIDCGNANANFNVGLGNAAGDYSYLSSQVALGTSQNGVKQAELGYNENMATGDVYFTFRNTSNNTSSSGSDPVTLIDWIGFVGSDDFPITGVTSASYVYGAAYAPATAKSSYLAAKTAAEATIADATYSNVTGEERTNLQAAINAAVEDNDAAYNTATDNIQTNELAFTSAKANYDSYATAKADAEGVNEADVLTVVIAGNNAATAADAAKAAEILPKAFAVKAATAAVPVTTGFVVNGTFDSNKDGWTATGGFQNNQLKDATQGTLNKFWENWNGSAKINKMYQAIENIPNGTYRLNISAFVNNLDADNQYVFANNDKTSLTSGATTGADYEVYTVVTNNQIEIGLEQTTATANWMGIDNVSLHYYGAGDVVTDAKNASHKPAWLEAKAAAETAYTNSDYTNVIGSEKTALETEIGKAEPSTAEGYDAAAVALNNATATFTAAKANYDALVAEIENAKSLGVATATAESYAATSTSTAASALANVQSLNVEEYTAVTTKYDTDGSALFIPSWDNSNFGSLTEQHWSGEAREYFDKWSGSAFNSSISKTVTLPEGHYAFYAAGRGQINSPSAVTLKVEISGGATLTQSYNMKGDTGKGIDTSGAANFGEGTFANGGAGRGWEWRYIAFDLDAETSVTLSIEGSGNNSWVGACDTKLLTYENIEVSRRLYNTNKDAAIAARDNSDYVNVAGTERTTLVSAINASVIETYAGYNTAAENLAAATSAFTAAKSSYDAWVAVKDEVYADDKPYASATKYAAIATAQEATPTTAADAATATNAVVSAYRKYVESNAMAEGVDGAVDKTSLISDPNMDVTYDGTAHTFGAWQVFSQTDGTISLKTDSDEPLTDSEGNKYKYADIWKSDNNGGIKQTLSNLPAGKYLLTVAARAQNAADATFGLFAGSARTEIARIDNVGGEFGNGWNDAYVVFVVHETSDVEIGVQSGNGKTMWWGATRFRLVRLGDAFEPVAVTAAGYKTYCSKNDLDFTGMEVKAYKATATDKKVTFTPVTTVPAGEGVLLKGAGTFNVPVTAGVTAWAAEDNAFIGVTSETKVDGPIFVLMNGTSGVGFYKATAAKFTVGANTAYLPESAAASRMFIGFDDEEEVTGIRELNSSANKGAIYNMNGVRVEKAKKGLYIQNGKKFVVK